MQAEERNYGLAGENDAVTGEAGTGGPAGSVGLTAKEEKAWSVVAHLSIFLNLVTGLLGPVAAFAIWFVFKDRSKDVAFHALQSMWFQIGWLVILAAGWAMTGLLTLILIGFLLIPVMALVSIVPFAHAAYAAYRVGSDDRGFRYPIVADMMDRR